MHESLFDRQDTDCGFLTILAQDLPGLEVEDPQTKEWKSVEPIEDTFVVKWILFLDTMYVRTL